MRVKPMEAVQALEVKQLYCYKCHRTRKVKEFLGERIKGVTRYWIYRLECGHLRTTRRNIPAMKLITIHLPPALIQNIKLLVAMGRYASVAHFVRYAVRHLLWEEFRGIEKEKELIDYFVRRKIINKEALKDDQD